MPANPQQLHDAVKQIGSRLMAEHQIVRRAQEAALLALRQVQGPSSRISDAIAEAVASESGLRCAVPVDEDPSVGFDCPPGATAPAILAVDGSQAGIDRHGEVMFAIINIGSVLLKPGSGAAPATVTDTQLLFGDQLYSPAGPLLSDGDLALMRDAAERRHLLANAPALPGLITLVDGPLELWGAKDVSDAAAFDHALRDYLEVLRELQRRGCTVAGYVDKPAADLVIRMLEISGTQMDLHPAAGQARLFRGASDRWLLAQILRPGQRSAIFALQSASRSRYLDDLAIHFFYLNVGTQTQPALARIELPRWVAADPARISAVHRALLAQCAILGARPYPYILHRAHETARITPQEADQIKHRLLLEMRNQGLEPDAVSGKSSAKLVSGIKGRH